MNSNTTPTSRRNRSRSSDTPQQDPDLGFQAFAQQGYIPQPAPNVGFQQFQQHPYIPHQFTYHGLLQQGFTPANHQLPQPAAFNAAIDLEEEFVPETQEPQTPQSISTQQSNPERQPNPTPTQKGKKKKFENRAPRQVWSKEEELALVSAWVDVSEDPVVGNAQSGGNIFIFIIIYYYYYYYYSYTLIYINVESFWKRIEKVFYKFVGRQDYRTFHQLNTKFKDLNKKITCFAGIYNNLVNNRSSGMSEADILQTAHYRYREDNGVPFIHEQAWEVLKKSPKWNPVPTMSTNTSRASKRTKTSDDDDEDVRVDEIEQLQRPIGRNKAKRASTSNTTGSNPDESVTQLLSQISSFNDQVDNTMDYKMKKLELEEKQLQLELEKRFDKDFEFFIAPHDHLTGDILRATLAKKERIRKLHNF